MGCSARSGGVARSICARNRRDAVARCRRVTRPSTSPVATVKDAYRFVVLCHLESWVRCSTCPGCSGRMGGVRPRVWICIFSSTESTSALPGGFRESPTTFDDLLSELRVPPALEGLEPMGFDGGGLPDLPHLPLRDTGVARHQPRTPMGCLYRHASSSQQQDALDGSPVDDGRSRSRAVHRSGVVGRRNRRFKVSRLSGSNWKSLVVCMTTTVPGVPSSTSTLRTGH